MGRPYTVADASGTTTDAYDAYGNLKEEQTPEGTIWHVYDPATGRLTETNTDYTKTGYGYDAQGRLWTVTVRTRTSPTGTWSAPATATYTYDGVGNKQTETLPNGDVTTYSYDDLNRLVLESISHNGTLMETLDYNQVLASGTKDPLLMLRPDGNRGGLVDTIYGTDGTTVTSVKTFKWTYDDEGRLTKEELAATDAALNYSDAYQFDLAGNRTRDDHTGKAHGGISADHTAYIYNGDDQLITSGPDANSDSVPDVATATTLTYDANGSQTLSTAPDGSTTAYNFDVRNKMVAVRLNGSLTPKATYVYDNAGNRVEQTTDGTAIYYVTDNANPTGYAQPVEERTSPTAVPTVRYLIGDHVYGQQSATATPTYYLTDGHGSTIALADGDTGAVVQTLAYTAYGDPLNFTTLTVGGTAVAHLFGGDAVFDAASGLYLHSDGIRGRNAFRFVEADERGNADPHTPLSSNSYLYAAANPVLFEDYSGHSPSLETIASVGVRGILALVGAGTLVSAVFKHWHATSLHAQLPATVATASVLYHSEIIANSNMTANQLFALTSSLKLLPANVITADIAPTSTGQIVEFTLHGVQPTLGQRPFKVEVVNYDTTKRLMSVRVLDGHPLNGWRAWQVTPMNNGNIMVETWSVDEPHDWIESTKFALGGETAQKKTWTDMLSNIAQASGGQVVGGTPNGQRLPASQTSAFYNRLNVGPLY